MTRQRETILKVIQDNTEHLTAEEIYMLAKQKLPKLALGTVYRNLGLMVENREIGMIAIPGEPNRYDRLIQKHDHFRCTRCHRLFDIPPVNIIGHLEYELGLQITGYCLTVEGICSRCTDEQASE